jgi:hypothetical protein
MPAKKKDPRFDVEGRTFVWHPLDDDDDRTTLEPVRLPLRLKIRALRSVAALSTDMDAAGMFSLLGAIVPEQEDALDEMDLNDFMVMFSTWQEVYERQNGATLGEASGSPS